MFSTLSVECFSRVKYHLVLSPGHSARVHKTFQKCNSPTLSLSAKTFNSSAIGMSRSLIGISSQILWRLSFGSLVQVFGLKEGMGLSKILLPSGVCYCVKWLQQFLFLFHLALALFPPFTQFSSLPQTRTQRPLNFDQAFFFPSAFVKISYNSQNDTFVTTLFLRKKAFQAVLLQFYMFHLLLNLIR